MGGGYTNSVTNIRGYALKADIKHYFETVDHNALLSIIRKRIHDQDILWLIQTIISNHDSSKSGKGMPLGNLTSQFFANVYLAELDYYVKHTLKIKYYVRYVDDFVILSRDKQQLQEYKEKINNFLKEQLKLELHPEKSGIIPLNSGITLLGFRVFYHFKLLKKSNIRRLENRLLKFQEKLREGKITKEHILLSLAGWEGYARIANTYNLRKKISARIETLLKNPMTTKVH